MTHRPQVSVVIPFLDPPAAFMEEALESVFAQTFEDWELLLVNDGSGPEATALAEEYAARDPQRVRCLEHPGGENLRTSASRNLGIRHARGELVAFLDADDLWFPNKLEDQIRLFREFPDAAMTWGVSLHWRSWDEASVEGDFSPSLGIASGAMIPPREAIRLFLTGEAAVPCPSSVLARTEVVRAAGGFEAGFPDLYEDQAFYAKIALRFPVVAFDQIWDRYRLREDSLTGAAPRRKSMEVRALFLTWLADFLKREGIRDPALERLVAREAWAIRHPLGGRALRALRRGRRWTRRMLVPRRSPAPRAGHHG